MATNIGKEISDALPALHAISGCDARSAFYVLAKKKIYKIVKNSKDCKEALARFGNNHTFDQRLFPVIQRFVAELGSLYYS